MFTFLFPPHISYISFRDSFSYQPSRSGEINTVQFLVPLFRERQVVPLSSDFVMNWVPKFAGWALLQLESDVTIIGVKDYHIYQYYTRAGTIEPIATSPTLG